MPLPNFIFADKGRPADARALTPRRQARLRLGFSRFSRNYRLILYHAQLRLKAAILAGCHQQKCQLFFILFSLIAITISD